MTGVPSLRIYFSAEDLARIRVAAGPDLLWELVLSVHVLGARHVPPRFAPWRRRTLARLAGARQAPVRPLLDVVPPTGAFPDFLTPPAAERDDLGAALEVVATTPARRLADELAVVFARRRASPWVTGLAAGQPAPMHALIRALRTYYEQALAGYQRQIADVVHADRALRARQVLDGGVETLLAGLPPPIRWRRPVLHSAYVRDRDVHLGGRGITLIPSYFCHRHPVTLIDPELPPVLVYPAAQLTGRAGSTALAALLGPTRARALTALQVPCSTSELARYLHASIGTASKHTAALRDAGLVTTTRHGASVRHALTSLGTALLASNTDQLYTFHVEDGRS